MNDKKERRKTRSFDGSLRVSIRVQRCVRIDVYFFVCVFASGSVCMYVYVSNFQLELVRQVSTLHGSFSVTGTDDEG